MLAIEQISVHFRDHAALQDLSLSIASGQVFGLPGPNSAGKKTLIRALMGLQISVLVIVTSCLLLMILMSRVARRAH